MTWFEVEIATGEIRDFDKKCNSIDYSDQNYLVCKNDSNKGITTLELIPHWNVQRIIRRSDTE